MQTDKETDRQSEDCWKVLELTGEGEMFLLTVCYWQCLTVQGGRGGGPVVRTVESHTPTLPRHRRGLSLSPPTQKSPSAMTCFLITREERPAQLPHPPPPLHHPDTPHMNITDCPRRNWLLSDKCVIL